MNNMSKNIESACGVVLTDNVDMDWLNQLTPRYHKEFVKFVVNVETNQVAVGMDIHADAKMLLGEDETVLYGGNIYPNGEIDYQSTLNIEKVLERKKKSNFFSKIFSNKDSFNPRIITDKDTIELVNAVLLAWVKVK